MEGKGDPSRVVLVGLGDYVDRGPDSEGVLDLVCEARRAVRGLRVRLPPWQPRIG